MYEKRKELIEIMGGICIFVKKSFLDNKFLERIYEETADCVTLRIIGSSLHDMVDIVMVFTYISPEGSYIYDNSDFDGIQLLEKHLLTIKSNFSDALLFIAGDLNARTELVLDYIPDDNLKFIFGDVTYVEDNFDMVRRNKDKKHNQFGKNLIDLCCTFDIHIMNGRLFDDRDGNITCTSGNGWSVVDYNIASTDLFKYATYFCVLDRSESDHFPIQCSFSFPTAQIVSPRITRTIEYHNISSSYQTDSFKWDENKKQTFIAIFSLKFTFPMTT